MKKSREELTDELIKKISQLPANRQKAMYFVIDNFHPIKRMCENSKMDGKSRGKRRLHNVSFAYRSSAFMYFKLFALMPRRAPYFCADRNRGKSRRKPFQLGFRTFLNDQRGKLPFGNPYYNPLQIQRIIKIKRFKAVVRL